MNVMIVVSYLVFIEWGSVILPDIVIGRLVVVIVHLTISSNY
jgi:hypothetical protein